MIINNVGSLSNVYASSAVASAKYSNSVSGVRAVRGNDKVIFSNEAQSFKEMLGKLQNTSEVRQDKVAEFEQKIANGTYSVASENIAASILSSRF
ncbi:MAG: flagellar biosynthesis anti-sigma factor FlgM [Selenomonadaceae bacterium]|nr:flagellar biosynthesis anti-sigma factor FlgM [Selenomonadaceae bacterium]